MESVHEKKGQGNLSLAPNLLLNGVSCPLEAQCNFFPVFRNFVPYVTKQGSNAVFILFYGQLHPLAEVDLSSFIEGFYIKIDFVLDTEAFIFALKCFSRFSFNDF